MAYAEFAPLRPDRDPEVGTSDEEFLRDQHRPRSCGIIAAVGLSVVAIVAALTATVAVGVLTSHRGTPATVEGATVLMYPFKKNKTSPCATAPPAPMATTTPKALATTTPKALVVPVSGGRSPCATVAPSATQASNTLAPVLASTPTAVTTCPPLSPCATLSSQNASFTSSEADYFVKNARQVSPAFQKGLAKGAHVSPCDIKIKSVVLGGKGNATVGGRRLLAGHFIVYYSIVVGKAAVNYEALITRHMKLVITVINEELAAMGIVARVGEKSFTATTTKASASTTVSEAEETTAGIVTGVSTTASAADGATTALATTASTTSSAKAAPEPEPEPEPEAESGGNTLSGSVLFDVSDTGSLASSAANEAFASAIAAGAGVGKGQVKVTGASSGGRRLQAGVWTVTFIMENVYFTASSLAAILASNAAKVAASSEKALASISIVVQVTISKAITVVPGATKDITDIEGGASAVPPSPGTTTAAAPTGAPEATTAGASEATTSAATGSTASVAESETTAAAGSTTGAAESGTTSAAATETTAAATTSAPSVTSAGSTATAAVGAVASLAPEPEPEPEA